MNNIKIGAVVVAIIALFVGTGVGLMLGDKNENKETHANTQSTAASSGAGDLRVLLNNLESEHVDLAAAATRAGFDGDPSFAAAGGALGKNTDSLAAAVASVYGDEAGAKFKEIWASHIGFFVDYTVAAKAGDQAGMAKAVENLNGYVDAVSTFLSSANPNLPKEAVATLVGEHVGLLKEAVYKHGAGDFAGSYDAQSRARVQITNKIADTLSGAIVKQKNL